MDQESKLGEVEELEVLEAFVFIRFARDIRLGSDRYLSRVWYQVSDALAQFYVEEYRDIAMDIRAELPEEEVLAGLDVLVSVVDESEDEDSEDDESEDEESEDDESEDEESDDEESEDEESDEQLELTATEIEADEQIETARVDLDEIDAEDYSEE